MKNLNFPTFHIYFTHSQCEFLKDFLSSESLDPEDHFVTNGSRIHPVLTKKNIAPQEMVVSIQSLLHSNLCDSLINNIKTIFL